MLVPGCIQEPKVLQNGKIIVLVFLICLSSQFHSRKISFKEFFFGGVGVGLVVVVRVESGGAAAT